MRPPHSPSAAALGLALAAASSLIGACGSFANRNAPAAADRAAAEAARPATPAGRDGFVALCNGRDLSGWVVVNGAPETWTVRDGMIVCSGRPAGVLRSARMYENFVLELEWRHLQPGGNAGLFLWADPIPARGQPFPRAIEVQVMDGVETENYTSHGDVFSIHGARMKPDRPHPAGWERCLPSEKRCRPAPQWNHYRLTCLEGTIKLEVNGAEVSGGRDVTPRKGYLCLESEGSEVHFRNLRIRELPAAAELPQDAMAAPDLGFRPLYNGLDLRGWRAGPEHAGHWKPQDWILDYDGKGADLWSSEELGDFQLIADWRWSGPPREMERPVLGPDGREALDAQGRPLLQRVQDCGDSGIYLRGSSKAQVNIWCWPAGSGEVYGYRTDPALPPEVRVAVTPREKADAPLGQWNRFVITVIGDRLSVTLNDRLVIDNAALPGLEPRGPIALQHHGDPIQFANLYLRELPAHPALIPAPREDAWGRARVAQLEARARRHQDARVVFLGDSITQGWESEGRAAWAERYAGLPAVNLGIGGDRTEHVLWRLQQGHLDPLRPEVVVLMIGTNNTGARMDPPERIAAGVDAILRELELRMPRARVLLLGIFPRGRQSDDPMRENNARANALLRRLADGRRVVYRDIGAAFLQPDGVLTPEIMPDFLHLSAQGYAIWAEEIEQDLRRLLR